MDRCAACGYVFAPKSMRCASSLQGGDGKELCIECSDTEENRIEAEGTNHLPLLLETYTFTSICSPDCDHRNPQCVLSCFDVNEVREPDYYNRKRG